MNQKFLSAFLLSFLTLTIACTVVESESTAISFTGKLDRKIEKDPTDSVLKILETTSLNNAVIKVNLCIMYNGHITFAELLEDETTFDLPIAKQKSVLKTIFQSTKFESRDLEEECAEFTIS